MEIQQHDGVVVEVAGSRQGFAKRKRGAKGVTGGREAPGTWVRLPSLPSTIYRGPGGRRPLQIPSNGRGRRPRGWLGPQARWRRPHPLRVSNPRRKEGPRGAHQPTKGWLPSHFSP